MYYYQYNYLESQDTGLSPKRQYRNLFSLETQGKFATFSKQSAILGTA